MTVLSGECIFIDRVALAKQGDNVIGSVRPSVCPSVCTLPSATKSKEESSSVEGVCVLNNCADAVDQLLIDVS